MAHRHNLLSSIGDECIDIYSLREILVLHGMFENLGELFGDGFQVLLKELEDSLVDILGKIVPEYIRIFQHTAALKQNINSIAEIFFKRSQQY